MFNFNIFSKLINNRNKIDNTENSSLTMSYNIPLIEEPNNSNSNSIIDINLNSDNDIKQTNTSLFKFSNIQIFNQKSKKLLTVLFSNIIILNFKFDFEKFKIGLNLKFIKM